MNKPKAWAVDEEANRVAIEWQDGRKSSIPMTDIALSAFIKTYMTTIPQSTIREHLDMICDSNAELSTK